MSVLSTELVGGGEGGKKNLHTCEMKARHGSVNDKGVYLWSEQARLSRDRVALHQEADGAPTTTMTSSRLTVESHAVTCLGVRGWWHAAVQLVIKGSKNQGNGMGGGQRRGEEPKRRESRADEGKTVPGEGAGAGR